MKEIESWGFIAIILVVLLCLGYYVIYNPIIKLKDGCWSWERENKTTYLLNYSCQEYIQMRLLEVVPNVNYTLEETFCGDKLLKVRYNPLYRSDIIEELEDCFEEGGLKNKMVNKK